MKPRAATRACASTTRGSSPSTLISTSSRCESPRSAVTCALVTAVRDSTVEIITNAQVTELRGEAHLEEVEVTVDGQEARVVKAQALVAALGFIADLGAIQQWGLVTSKRHVVVDSAMRTNLPRVFAAGDITDYPGKVRLIAVGFGEAATT